MRYIIHDMETNEATQHETIDFARDHIANILEEHDYYEDRKYRLRGLQVFAIQRELTLGFQEKIEVTLD